MGFGGEHDTSKCKKSGQRCAVSIVRIPWFNLTLQHITCCWSCCCCCWWLVLPDAGGWDDRNGPDGWSTPGCWSGKFCSTPEIGEMRTSSLPLDDTCVKEAIQNITCQLGTTQLERNFRVLHLIHQSVFYLILSYLIASVKVGINPKWQGKFQLLYYLNYQVYL